VKIRLTQPKCFIACCIYYHINPAIRHTCCPSG